MNRKLLLIGADATIAVTTLVLAVLLWRGEDGLWLIYAALAIRSLGAGIQMPAVGALLPQIVPVEHLMRVNGINASTGQDGGAGSNDGRGRGSGSGADGRPCAAADPGAAATAGRSTSSR